MGSAVNETLCFDDILVSDSINKTSEPISDYYEYMEYDYEADPNNVPIQELIPVSIIYGLTLVIGLVGNTLVIVSVAKFKKMQNVTNMFLLSLASADLMLVLVCVPVKRNCYMSGGAASDLFYDIEAWNVVCNVSIYAMMYPIRIQTLWLKYDVAVLNDGYYLSICRYYAIMHPIRAKCVSTVALAKKTVLVIWFLSLIMASPILIGRIHKPVGSGNNTWYWCALQWEKPIYGKVYGTYMFLIILAIPLCLMTFAYASICQRVWTLHKRRPQAVQHSSRYKNKGETAKFIENKTPVVQELSISNQGYLKALNVKSVPIPNDINTRKQVIKMLVAVVLLFMLCWGPITTNNLLVAYGVLDNLHQGYLRPLRIAFFLMSYFNSCTNPIVYAFMSRNFRNTFKHTLSLLCRRRSVSRQSYHMTKLSGDNRSCSLLSNKTTNALIDVTDVRGHLVDRGTVRADNRNGTKSS